MQIAGTVVGLENGLTVKSHLLSQFKSTWQIDMDSFNVSMIKEYCYDYKNRYIFGTKLYDTKYIATDGNSGWSVITDSKFDSVDVFFRMMKLPIEK
ncbi:MAG: hypothetical protein JJV95_04905 [Sulfurospirillum sp.]|nr:hypothetical protein [Sulfurospirillum sp.]